MLIFVKSYLHVLRSLYNFCSWFVGVEPSLHAWDKSNLIMVYGSFNVWLNSACSCFVEDFCICVPQWCIHAKLVQSCLTHCDPMDCSPPRSSVHGILQARILEWVVGLDCNFLVLWNLCLVLVSGCCWPCSMSSESFSSSAVFLEQFQNIL